MVRLDKTRELAGALPEFDTFPRNAADVSPSLPAGALMRWMSPQRASVPRLGRHAAPLWASERPLRRISTAASMRAVVKPPLNSEVQCIVGSLCCSRDVVIHDSVANACVSLTQGASETQGRGYSCRARCSVELLSVPAPGRSPHTKCAQSAGSKPRLPTRPIFADGRAQATRCRFGRVDLQFSRYIVLCSGQ